MARFLSRTGPRYFKEFYMNRNVKHQVAVRAINGKARTAKHAQEPCPGCSVKVGELHSKQCPVAPCWKCGNIRMNCGCDELGIEGPFVYTGDLEPVFTGFNKSHGDEMAPDEFDYKPEYKANKMFGLRSNGFDPGVWRSRSRNRCNLRISSTSPSACLT